MWFWECPKRGCPFSTVSDDERDVISAADRHLDEGGHEQWREAVFTPASHISEEER